MRKIVLLLPLFVLLALGNTLFAQTIITAAGNGIAGYSGDGGPATAAEVNFLSNCRPDNFGNFYIADLINYRIRIVNSVGIINTFAGIGVGGFSGDGGLASAAEVSTTWDVLADTSHNVYIDDQGNGRIRLVNSSGIISTFAGGGFSMAEGVPATTASLSSPLGLAFDTSGNLYITDQGNNRIRMVNMTTRLITTIAGNGVTGYSGDGGPATAAELNHPYGIDIDRKGNLYIAEDGNNTIRKVSASTGIITTIAGNGVAGFTGDGGPASASELNQPYWVAVDDSADVYIADVVNQRIRMITNSGIINTVVGNGAPGFSGDGGPATSAELYSPEMVSLDKAGNIYIGDVGNQRCRKVIPVTTEVNSFAQKTSGSVSLYPTFVQQSYTISFNQPQNGLATFIVFDIFGRKISEKTIDEYTGNHKEIFSVTGLSAGTYYMQFKSGNVVETKKFVVLGN